MPLQPGSTFAGYTVIRLLGAGGMGAVYLARHPRLPRQEALKILTAGAGADAEFRARFEREADLAAGLDHPNIVTIYDRGIHEESPWISMQFVGGSDAAHLIAQGPAILTPRRVVDIITQAARGLDHAHEAGLLHRDVKPANLLVAPDRQGGDHVYVADFGIARSIFQSTTVTATGVLVATIAYAAPEILEGRPIDHRVDVYALGCTLYQMLTGSVPFPRSSTAAVMRAHLFDPPPRISDKNRALPAAMDAVIARAMAKDPAHRFATAGELAAAAEAALHAKPVPPPPPPTPSPAPSPSPSPAPSRRAIPRSAVVALAVILLLLIGTVVGVALMNRDSNQGSPVASSSQITSTTTVAAATTTTSSISGWGRNTELVSLLPGLLPNSPNAVGYQDTKCEGVNFANNGGSPAVKCTQENGLEFFAWTVEPGAQFGDGTNIKDELFATNIDNDTTREEAWTRSSGTGRVRWSYDPGSNYGLLTAIFDDQARSNIVLDVSWGHHTGQEIYDQWWAGAPI